MHNFLIPETIASLIPGVLCRVTLISEDKLHLEPGYGFSALSGIPDERIKNEPDLFFHQIHPIDQVKVLNNLKDFRNRTVPLDLELSYSHPEQGDIFLRARIQPEHEAKNLSVFLVYIQIIETSTVSTDSLSIMEKEQSGNSVPCGKEKFQQSILIQKRVVDTMTEAVYLIDEKGFIRYGNQTACRELGYSYDELIRLHIESINPEASPDRWKKFWPRFRREGNGRLEGNHVRYNGTQFPVENYTRLISFEGKEYCLSIVHNISRRKESDRKIQILSHALDQSSDSAFLMDQKGRFLYVNEAASRILGYSHEELLSMTPMDIDPDIPGAQFQQMLQSLFASGPARENTLTTHRRKDGMIFPVEIFASIARVGDEKFALTIARDITERKAAEQTNRKYIEFLESLDLVNRALQGTEDLEKMMETTLSVVRSLFGSDRAFLSYPCNPAAATWSIPMESTKPEYPGLQGEIQPLDQPIARTYQLLLDSGKPEQFGPGTEHPIPIEYQERYHFKNYLAMALFPGIGEPWQFGIHQCSHEKQWSQEEIRLFEEIGRRLGDRLHTLLLLRDLQITEEKLRTAQSIARVGYWERNFETNRAEMDIQTARNFGVDKSSLRLSLGEWEKLWSTLLHPDDREAAAIAMAESLEKRTSYNIDYRVIHSDGSIHHLHSHAVVETDTNSNVLRVRGMVQDVTEQNKTHERIRQSEQEYRILAESSPDFIARYDRKGRFLYINDRLIRLLGLSGPGEVMGRIPVEIWPDGRFSPVQEGSAAVVKSGEMRTIDLTVPLPDGNREYHQILIVPERDNTGSIVGALCFGRDMTDLYRMRETITQQEQEFRSLAESSPDSIIRYDREGRIRYLNSKLEKDLGFTLSVLEGKRTGEVWPDGRFSVIEDAIRNTLHEEKINTIILHSAIGTQEKRYHQIRIVPEKDAFDRIIGTIAFGSDVTDLYILQESLSIREQEFRSLAENSPDIIIRYDRECRQIYANPSAVEVMRKLLGRTPIGETPSEAYPDGSFTEYEKTLERVIATGTVQDFEFYLPGENDCQEIHLIRIAPEKNSKEEVIGAIILGRDITSLKNKDEQLYLLNRAINQSRDAIYYIDADLVIRYVNDAALQMLDYRLEELVGSKVSMIDPQIKPEILSEMFGENSISNGKLPLLETYHYRKDGTALPVEISSSLIEESQKFYSLSIVRDITERKKADAILRESEERYHQIFENASDGMVLLEVGENNEPAFVECNPEFLYMTGLSYKDLSSKSVFEWKNVEIATTLLELSRKVLSSGKNLHQEATLLVGKRTRYFSLSTILLPGYGERKKRILQIWRNITAKVLFDKLLNQKQRAEVIGDLASHIAHDFKNILGIIILNAGFLRTGAFNGSSLDIIHRIQNAAEKADSLIKQMLDFRMEEKLSFEPLSLAKLIYEYLPLLGSRTETEKIRIEHRFPPEGFFVSGNATRLKQMILNLCINGLQAMKNSEGILTIGLSRTSVSENSLAPEHSILTPGKYVLLTIHDTGPGIDMETQERIFDPFFTTRSDGTGLGLSIVQTVVENHSGLILLKSSPGRGTEFQVWLPELNLDRTISETEAWRTIKTET